MKIPNVWTLKGDVDRATYFLTGVVLMAIKYALDKSVAWYGFHQPWSLANYFSLGFIFRIVPATDWEFYAVMLAMALPFIWIGIAMTTRRLRDANLPLPLALLFVFRPANWLLIAVLTLMPTRTIPSQIPQTDQMRFFDAVVPRSDGARAVFAVSITVLMALGFTLLCIDVFGDYAWALFIGLPGFIGFLPAWIYSSYAPRSGDSMGARTADTCDFLRGPRISLRDCLRAESCGDRRGWYRMHSARRRLRVRDRGGGRRDRSRRGYFSLLGEA